MMDHRGQAAGLPANVAEDLRSSRGKSAGGFSLGDRDEQREEWTVVLSLQFHGVESEGGISVTQVTQH